MNLKIQLIKNDCDFYAVSAFQRKVSVYTSTLSKRATSYDSKVQKVGFCSIICIYIFLASLIINIRVYIYTQAKKKETLKDKLDRLVEVVKSNEWT